MTEKFNTAMIVVDTRESCPLAFAGATRTKLDSGDYSLRLAMPRGPLPSVAIERKTVSDLYGCIGRERERFERELIRLADLDYAAIVIEGTMADVLTGPMDASGEPRSRIHKNAAMGSLLSWSVRYRLPIFFTGNTSRCRATVYRLLRAFWKERQVDKAIEDEYLIEEQAAIVADTLAVG